MNNERSMMNQNLQLALLESVLNLDDVDTDALMEHCDARLMEIEENPALADELWSKPVPELIDYVLGQGLQAHFGRVTSLYLDGGSEIYGITSLFWDGEDDVYDITSFEGIEACSNLVSVKASTMISLDQPVSLAPLAKLPKLEVVWINAGSVADVESLLEAPSLKAVEVGRYANVVDGDIDELNEKFLARGVSTSTPS